MKLFMFFLLLLPSAFYSYANESHDKDNASFPYCTNMSHTAEITVCIMDVAIQKKKEYQRSFNKYFQSISSPEERPYDKATVARLARKAKKGWDTYIENECLAEASVYEKNSYGYNDTYHICLITGYDSRIKYYKKNLY